jgi:hypothetical protein
MRLVHRGTPSFVGLRPCTWYTELCRTHNGYTLRTYRCNMRFRRLLYAQPVLSPFALCVVHILFVAMLISYFYIRCLLLTVANLLG